MSSSSRKRATTSVYREDVLKKHVHVKFEVDDGGGDAFYRGQIRMMQLAISDDDEDKLDISHYVVFEDGDEIWFDLVELERNGRLRWDQEDDDRKPAAMASATLAPPSSVPDPAPSSALASRRHDVVPDSSPSSAPTVVPSSTQPDEAPSSALARRSTAAPDPFPSSARTDPSSARAQVVTPEKRPHKKRKKEKKKKKTTPKVASGRRLDYINSDDICLKDLSHWLKEIHRGAKGNKLSKDNVRSCLKQARKLIKGEGITYHHWPAGTYFYRGERVDLSYDFADMLEQAKLYEKRYGRDLGNGWVLRHPIKKLLLYKDEYAHIMRERKRQFLAFMCTTQRQESPSAVVSGVSDILKTVFTFVVRNKEELCV